MQTITVFKLLGFDIEAYPEDKTFADVLSKIETWC